MTGTTPAVLMAVMYVDAAVDTAVTTGAAMTPAVP
jgi:hypothetical protein